MRCTQRIVQSQSKFCVLNRFSFPICKARSHHAGFVRGSLLLLWPIALLLLADSSSAQSQERFDNSNNFGNFGIETPGQHFLREGREQFEEEIHQLQTFDRTSEGLLTIDDNVNPQENLLPFEDPCFHPTPSSSPDSSPINPMNGQKDERGG